MNPSLKKEVARPGHASAAFALAAAAACIFNTLLAWAKDAYAPLNKLMGSLTGHHWITHGLADCILFFGLGWILSKGSFADTVSPDKLTSILIWSVVGASVGLFAWFLFF
jgi:hypothetical protein